MGSVEISKGQCSELSHVVMLLGNLRALERVWVEGIAKLERLGSFSQAFDELVVDAGLDENPGAGCTCLACVKAEDRSISWSQE